MCINILIVGANFDNKGAQSMLFVTMDEIKKRLPKAKIYYAASERKDISNYKFEYVYTSKESKSIALNKKYYVSLSKAVFKGVVKTFLGKNRDAWKFFELKEIMSNIDMIIDISGFNLGNKWDAFTHEYYLDNIRLAKKYSIPIYLMPQSFGPFDYSKEKEYLINDMAELLPYASLIFSREKDGYRMLIETFKLRNLKLSSDLVLQNNGVDLNNVYKNIPNMDVPVVGNNCVGIIPNNRCFVHGDKFRILDIYKSIIETLIKLGKDIYIFRHSLEDLNACKEVFRLVHSERVHLLENDFTCFEYDQFIREFDFVICSRYHGVVHAYRNFVPSVLLGWAVKYHELAELLGQEKYSFDITSKRLTTFSILAAIEELNENYENESRIIKNKLTVIQNNNCFEFLSEGNV